MTELFGFGACRLGGLLAICRSYSVGLRIASRVTMVHFNEIVFAIIEHDSFARAINAIYLLVLYDVRTLKLCLVFGCGSAARAFKLDESPVATTRQ
jgi:hypothetical protein